MLKIKLKINDKPFKDIGTSKSNTPNTPDPGVDPNVVVTLSDPYYSTPSTIQVDILQITNKSSIQSMSWSVVPAGEEVLPELVVTQNSVSFEEAYYFEGMVLQLSVLLKNGQYQYYYVPVDLEGIPPFEAACEHSGDYLNFYTNASSVRLVVNGVNLGDIAMVPSRNTDELYTDGTINIVYSYIGDYEVYSHSIDIQSVSNESSSTPVTIEFFTGEDYYSVRTDLSNFPFIFDGDGYTTEVDISNLGYDTNGYFIANNCCFSPPG